MAEKVEKLNTKKAPAKVATKPAKAAASAKTDVATAPVVKQLVKAHARNLRLAPRKMRLVTNLVKDMRLSEAMTQLSFTNKKGAKMLQKLLQSAAANAENNFSMNRDSLFIKELTCDMGPVLQRSFPRARGSAFMIRRKMSHVHVVLEERAVKLKKKQKPKAVVPKAVRPEVREKFEEQPAIDPVSENIVETQHQEDTVVKETHHESESDLVKEKTSPQNLNK
ncbi:MAG TPA: 50S ribosomal protein L22 [Patescibacteria group bacterium]|jgi:large subunit ribosomal protein L22|nr:50S ribosomal protein L22 [Patescibacteria group bacterium]